MKKISYVTMAMLFFIQSYALGDKILLDAGIKGAYLRQEAELAKTGGFQGDFVNNTRQDSHHIRFKKDGPERRMIGVKLYPSQRWEEHKALDMSVGIKLAEGQSARPFMMIVELEGGSWCRVGMPFQENGKEDIRLNLNNMRQTAFSHDGNGKLDWNHIGEVYIGAVVEGAGEGELKIYNAKLTNEQFVPSKPLAIRLPMAKNVSRSADPAATSSIEDVEIDGVHVLKETFKFPLGRHMYFTPSFALPDLDYSSYSGIRLTYKARIPMPINGLLITLAEGGGQFVAPAPGATSDWVSVDLPFKSFTMAGWAKKRSGDKMDVENINRILIGCHGTANGDKGEGEILIRKLELIP